MVPDDFGGKELATSTSEAPIPRCAGSGSRQRWTCVLAALCSHRLVLLSDVWCREESCAEQLNLDCVSGKSQFPWPQLGPKLWQGTAQQKLTQKEI